MKLVFATHNQNKFKEVKSILPDSIELLSLSDIGCTEDIPETGSTIEANASQKSAYIVEHYQLNCFADDTGLEVETLNGAPGVYSARYAGDHKSNEDNIDKLLSELAVHSNRKARFKTVISLRIEDQEFLFEGIVNGEITKVRTGEKGFGYDPVFLPEGYDKTFAQLSMDEKNRISHRGRAIKKLAAHFK